MIFFLLGSTILAVAILWAAQNLSEAIRYHGSRVHDAAIANERIRRAESAPKTVKED